MVLIRGFDELCSLDREQIIDLLHQATNVTLVTALSSCRQEVVAKILSELSEEGRRLLLKDLEFARKVLFPSDAAIAQAKILEIINSGQSRRAS